MHEEMIRRFLLDSTGAVDATNRGASQRGCSIYIFMVRQHPMDQIEARKEAVRLGMEACRENPKIRGAAPLV